MNQNPNLEKNLVKTAAGAGIALSIMYPARTFLPLPDILSTAFYIFFGPLLVVAFVGLYPFLSKPKKSVSAILGTVFGVIGGAANMMFAVVQMNNLHYIFKYMRAAESPEAKEMWRNILNGVFTVQNGLNYVSDLFIDWTAFLFAVVMWSHPKFGKIFSILGFIAAGFHFVMKLITFPTPPAEAGLFDAGPMVSVWFALVTIQVIRNIKWMDETKS
jgi:hypothetical protein